MSTLLPFLLALLAAFILNAVKAQLIRKIESAIRKFTRLSKEFEQDIVPALIRTVRLNWYIFLVVALLFYILFFVGVGNDIIEAWLNKYEDNPGSRIPSLISLFVSTMMMSISMWLIPFFLLSDTRRGEIIERYKQFYLGTKILSLLAMLPFLILFNKIATFSTENNTDGLALIAANIFCVALFIFVVWLSQKIPNVPVLINLTSNRYLVILIRIMVSVTILALVIYLFPGRWAKYTTASFICISSAVLFRLLFFSVESAGTEVKELVIEMVGEKNSKHSKYFYWCFAGVLIIVTWFYYLASSLEPTNGLYILLIVFSFLLTYLDYWRNIYTNKHNFWKCVAFVATIMFLILPFIPNKNQFRISLIATPQGKPITDSLGTALKIRYDSINTNYPDGSIYIVCAMGGGSRAGYITAAVLREIDKIDPTFWQRTLCYSTVSGGSVGLYHYIKSKEKGIATNDSVFLKKLYLRNYNASGIYGLLLGDPAETMLGWIATGPKSLTSGGMPANQYFDRNYRIRQEYDIVLTEALDKKKEATNYFDESFYIMGRQKELVRDSFRIFYQNRLGCYPIHLVNTFEVNSGRRTVLSPFPADTAFFTNTVLPLQDRTFDCEIQKKDILYRDAVNLSELFPLISAASFLGSHPHAQFVDGGYYENYGLATALDVYYNLKKIDSNAAKRVKILLIKNSKQEAKIESHSPQYLAPLNGALSSPFTGHANNLLAEAKRVLDSANLYVTTFDADSMKVPLTRTLTSRHINAMNVYIKGLNKDTVLKRFVKVEIKDTATHK
ncbi:MAG: hypothetical protein QM731_28100 [Chitinophagaceae bacterium]